MSRKRFGLKHILIILLLIAIIVIVVICYKAKLHIVIHENGESSDDYKYTVEFEGSDRYTDEELSDIMFGEDVSKNAVKFWWNSIFGEKQEIPFIETYDIEMKSFGKFVITLYDKSVVGYVTYMSNNLYFDKDGIVVESATLALENVPPVTGLEFDYFVLHEKLPSDNEDIFELLLELTQLCDKYDIGCEKINITANDEVQLFFGTVRVDLGTGDMLNEKMLDLSDLYEELEGISGVLNMKEYDYEDNGYILKKN